MIDYYSIFTIFHLLGVVVGMGGAIVSDFIFFSSIRDQKISSTEMRFLKLGSRIVWLGLVLIVVSGIFLFETDPARYLNSSKFIAKMVIVFVVIINGIIFHFIHIPRLCRHVGAHFPSSDEFSRKAPLLLVSGVVSVISWLSTLFLGSLRSLPFSALEILGVYFILLLLAAAAVISLKKILIPNFQK